ncbi:calcium-binding protein [Limimaricola soesokkakensis]|uniref:calcium-binding protein n=1 Tax=Limimaricola soesokkakensis TaxID=1343159 RepID=UPI0013FDDF9B|nr:calcium-binding protein [Limimaricola soesokkakensis]
MRELDPLIITENTVWTSDKSYDYLGGVEIAEGVTLTIDPGVVVSNSQLRVYGRLEILGTTEDRVVFNSTTINADSRNFGEAGGVVEANYFDMHRGSLEPGAGTLALDNGYFHDIADLDLYGVHGANILSNSVFTGLQRLKFGSSDGSLELQNNSFYVPEMEWRSEAFLTFEEEANLTGNNFFTEAEFPLIEISDGATATVHVRENYFGTVDNAGLELLILDKHDSAAKAGEVIVTGTRDEPNPEAPVMADVNMGPTVEFPFEISVSENASADSWHRAGGVVYETADVDGNAATAYLTGVDAHLFEVEHNYYDWNPGEGSGSVSPIRWLDYERPSDSDGDGIYEVTLHVSDGMDTTSHALSIQVRNESDTPYGIRLEGDGVAENDGGALVGRLVAVGSSQPYNFSIDPLDEDRFEIVGDQLHLKDGVSLNYEQESFASVKIVATPASGEPVSVEFEFQVLDVNEAPSLEVPSLTVVDENYWHDTIDILSNDEDEEELTISLSGADAAQFETTGNAYDGYANRWFWLRDQPDFEAPTDANGDNVYELTVTVTDGTHTISKEIGIKVQDKNDLPEGIEFGGVDITENGEIRIEENIEGALIGKLSVIDQDSSDTYSFAIWNNGWQDQAWLDKFEIVGDELRLKPGVAFDYENWSGDRLTIRATAQNGDEISRSINIEVVDVNEAPSFDLPSSIVVGEHSKHDATTWLYADDPEWDEVTFTLSGVDSEAFEYDGWDTISLRDGIDYENPIDADGDNVYELTVTASDGLNTFEKSMTVEVLDENDAPQGITFDSIPVEENVEGALLGTLSVIDQDRGDTYNFALEDEWYSDDRFEIVGNELRLKPGVALDYESDRYIDVTVTATAENGDVISTLYGIDLRDVNEAPTFELPSRITIGEHSGYVYEYFDVADPEGKPLTISFSGADFAFFDVWEDSWEDGYGYGEFELREWLDFEAPADSDGDNIYEMTVAVSDGVNTVEHALEIEVQDENDSPERVVLNTVPVEENVTGAILGTLSVVDQDAGDTHSFELWDTRFEVVGDTLKLKDGVALDYEWDDSYVEISAIDQNGAQSWDYFYLDLRDVNEAPIFDLPTEVTLRENTAVDEEIYAWDPDWDDLTYELTGPDAEIALFYPREGSVEFVAPDFESPTDADGDGVYEVTFKVSDGEFTVSHDLRITVSDADERPDAIVLEQLPFEANVAGAVVGMVTVSDQDAGDTHDITVSDPRFEVVEGLLKLKAGESLDAVALNGLSLKLTATDSAGLSLTRSFEIEVDDPARAPTALTLTNALVAENAAGAVIGRLTVTDPNVGDTHSFAVSDDRFEVVGGALKLKAGVALDHEAAEAVSVTVTAKDSGGLELAETFSVQVSDTSEVATGLTLSAASVAENATGAVVGQLSVIDPDAGDSHSFSVSDDRFEVVGGALKLRAGVALDHEATEAVSVTVIAKDSGDLELAETFSVQVSDANEVATGLTLSAASVAENAAGAVVGQLSVVDPDAGDVHSFTVSDDRFEVVGGALKLKSKASLDFEEAHNINLAVTAKDAAGLSLTQSFEIEIQDVAEGTSAPVDKVTTGSKSDDVLKGVKGNDVLVGDGGDDTINGGKGRDIVAGGAGADTLSGGKGFDTLDYSGSAKGVVVNLQKGVGKGGEAQGDKLSGFEGVIGSSADDKLLGSKGGNVLIGGQGADVLNGRGGKDWADYSASDGGVTVNLAKRSGSGGDAEGDRLINIERVHGSAQNDKLTGDNGKNILVGDAGKDRLVGGGGHDALDGGVGRDKLLGGAGKDKLSGGEGNDRLVGGAGKDWLDGGAGNDTVLGGGGADTFIFDLGSDKLVGGKGRDTVEFDGAFEDYGVTFGDKVIVTFEEDRDVLTGMERLEFDDITYARQGGDWVEVA